MDFFDEDLLLEEEDSTEFHDEDTKYKEQTILLIDAQPSMLETCTLDDPPEFSGLSWLAVAIKIAATLLRSKAISGSKDEMAIIFYNTANSSTTRMGLEHIYVEQHLDAPTITRIRSLQSIISTTDNNAFKQFTDRIGIGSNHPDERLRSLDSALWEATAMLPSGSNNSGVASLHDGSLSQRIIVCTRDQGPVSLPSDKAKTILTRVEILASKGGALQLLPMMIATSPSDDASGGRRREEKLSLSMFDFESFWIPLLNKAPLQADISYSGESGISQIEYIFSEQESIIPLKVGWLFISFHILFKKRKSNLIFAFDGC